MNATGTMVNQVLTPGLAPSTLPQGIKWGVSRNAVANALGNKGLSRAGAFQRGSALGELRGHGHASEQPAPETATSPIFFSRRISRVVSS